MATDMNAVVNVEQTRNQILNRLVNVLQGGIAVDPAPQSFTVAALPTTGVSPGQMAWAANARKTGEGAGAGTGLLVYYNGATSQWLTVFGNVLVTA